MLQSLLGSWGQQHREEVAEGTRRRQTRPAWGAVGWAVMEVTCTGIWHQGGTVFSQGGTFSNVGGGVCPLQGLIEGETQPTDRTQAQLHNGKMRRKGGWGFRLKWGRKELKEGSPCGKASKSYGEQGSVGHLAPSLSFLQTFLPGPCRASTCRHWSWCSE